MKKTAIIILLMLSTITMSAQFHYGVRLGGVFDRPCSEKADGLPSIDGGSGFSGGLTADYVFSRINFSVAASVLYEHRNIWATTPHDNAKVKFGGNFIAVPIDLKYRLPIHILYDMVSPHILTGPDLAWRLNHAAGRDFHIGWNVGLSVDVINLLQFSGGYRFGINDINPGGYTLRDSGAFFAAAILFSI